jgi:hypothetical protein
VQAAWLYAQMVRWGQATLSPEALNVAKAVFRPNLYDAALGLRGNSGASASEAMGAFAGPAFDAGNIAGYLASLQIVRRRP